jgi:capsular exopolysaccharide synthesis family protein
MSNQNGNPPADNTSGALLPSNTPPAENALAIRSSGALSTQVSAPAEADEFNIDLLGLWHILLKRRWTIAAAIALAFVTGLVISLLITPIYRATATVQIDRELMNVTTNDTGPVTDYWMDPDYINTQYQILQSREMASRVLTDMGYQNAKRFDTVFRASTLAEIKSWFTGANTSDKPSPALQKQQAIGRVGVFQRGYTIEPVRNTRLVKVHYNSPDPGFAIVAANSLVEAYQNRNLETRFDTANYAKTYLEDQLKQLKLKLEDSEAQLVRFAEKEQIVSTGNEEDGSLPEQNIGALNAALAKAKEDRIRAQSDWQQAQNSSGSLAFGEIGGNSMIRSLQESRSKLMTEYQDKLSTYKPAYPLMVQLKAQIDDLDKQITQELGSIRSAIRGKYEAAQQNENMIAEQIRSLTGQALNLKTRSIQYNVYKREVDTNRQLYEATLQRYKEIGVAAGVGLNNIVIVDRAVNTGKFRPNIPLNLAISLFLGLIGGVLLALLLEYLDDTLKNPEDVEKRLKLPVLGVIPKLGKNVTLEAATADIRSAFSEAYRSVRTSLQFSTSRGVPRSLLVTSSSPSEGKSTAALTLARNFTQLGKRVLLIDADMRKPSIHKKMAMDNNIGLSNFLAGAVPLTDALRYTDIPGLTIITTGPLPPNPAELLHDDNMRVLLEHGIALYDQIIIDGPPVMGLADAPILASHMEGVMLVVEAGVTRKAYALNSMKRLKSAHAYIVGVLINKYEAKHAAYGYSQGYGTHDYYGYGADEYKKLSK